MLQVVPVEVATEFRCRIHLRISESPVLDFVPGILNIGGKES